jgi:hypothetical protein
MRLRVLILLALVFGGATAWAHGNEKHIIGTVEKVGSDTVNVKTVDGKIVEVKLTEKTIYLQRDGKTAKLADIAVGEHVVIHAAAHGEILEATQVKFAKGTSGPASTVKPEKNR